MTFAGDFARATVRELVQALARREVGALELCDAAIARIERLDPEINAVVVRDFERARRAAREADAALARGEQGALLGVPMTVKESFDVAGLPTSWGLSEHRDFRPVRDAVSVGRLKRAGAVILGKTNVARALADWQSDNPVYGRTRNPLDKTRSPGGSSGGSAAALAAGMVPLELGSDIAGSIRVPAHFCGVFGHKPSYGLVPPRGHSYPGTDGAAPPLAVVGPLARNVDDLERALAVLAGPDDDLAIAYRLALPPPRRTGLRDLRVLVLDRHPCVRTAHSLEEALAGLATDLRDAGAQVSHESALLPDLTAANRLYLKTFLTIVSGGAPRADGTQLSAGDWLNLEHARVALARAWARLFEQVDVVITPPFGTAAFPHLDPGPTAERRLTIDGVSSPYGDQFAWPGVATLPGLPATQVPIARDVDNLPIGVQVIGPYLEDRTPIAVAAAIEKLRPLGVA